MRPLLRIAVILQFLLGLGLCGLGIYIRQPHPIFLGLLATGASVTFWR